ncbi:bifunctional adenosylcobinamide kinase/adenosylcobinamide-phosphate guanylyltransferase [Nocardioides sp. YIM 152315]|uniref:bifunctional adenosylcobinamide kinase/adenosylcobinamide-phosphate guanylyltransferase n=1 Tax=Nocardioides sp. YIM 152315 TaxID=3031760 RepID=UPI0023DA49E2|nr:bifunctional adenosylcobinamide kinase/adenosylcobinamide-phosphate guanylyltransferase [Nocardioides sp. YIM 152315]MDF1602000.1 bifunctional adenosylcobinamide kinase/adenosylcobinamide-phosphate guanylyltransferase [Nocardioides sp. YIM 152315]
MKVLVTGGVRSGKSRHAEELLAAEPAVRYVAPGPVRDDADWQARIAAHRARRPVHWSTLETGDLAAALATDDAVLVDCLGTWLARLVDDAGLWDSSMPELAAHVDERADRALGALSAAGGTVVLVSNEIGMGVVPEHRSGRVFRDLLGSVNQRFGAACDEVHLVVAGRVLVL